MATALAERTVSAPRAAELVGCSYRQLDYWCRIGLLDSPGNGSGSRREFTFTQVCELRLVATLYAMCAWQIVPDVLAWQRERYWAPDPWAGQVVVHRDGACTLNGRVRGAAWVVDLGACLPEAAAA